VGEAKKRRQAQSSSPLEKFSRKRHVFFLNPYEDAAFTKCPQCKEATKVRKFPLAIHIDPKQFFLLNKKCRYCVKCDLIIARKSEVQSLIASAFERCRPEIIGNSYLVIGTLDRKDWKAATANKIDTDETQRRTYVFEDVRNFKVIPAGWYPKDKIEEMKRQTE
jgi:hypothetical protein